VTAILRPPASVLIGLYANNIQIVQTRDSVVLMLEWNPRPAS
jgi:hypothetical protein